MAISEMWGSFGASTKRLVWASVCLTLSLHCREGRGEAERSQEPMIREEVRETGLPLSSARGGK